MQSPCEKKIHSSVFTLFKPSILSKCYSFKVGKKKEEFSVRARYFSSLIVMFPSLIFKIFEAKNFKSKLPDNRVCVWLKTLPEFERGASGRKVLDSYPQFERRIRQLRADAMRNPAWRDIVEAAYDSTPRP